MNLAKRALDVLLRANAIDEEHRQRARMLSLASSITILALSVFIAYYGFFEPSYTILPIAVVFLAVIGSYIINRRGSTGIASHLLLWSMLTGLFYLAAVNGGIDDTALKALPAVFIAAAVLMGKRSMLMFSLSGLLGVIALGLFQINNVIAVSALAEASMTDIFDLLVMNGTTIILVMVVSNSLKNAMTRAKLEEKRLSDIVSSAGEWVWEVDENCVYTYSSLKGGDLFGTSSGDVLGKKPFDFMLPEEATRVAAIFSEICARKEPIKDLENRKVAMNGERIDHLSNGVPIVDAQGNLKGYRGVDKDITARKKAERRLQERIKELDAFYTLSKLAEREDLVLEELYLEMANALPSSWQYPDVACARIVMGDREFRSGNFADSPWQLADQISAGGSVVGRIDIGYLEERPAADEGPFLKEEARLLRAISERIGKITVRHQAQEEVRKLEQQIEFILGASRTGLDIVDAVFNLRFVDPEWQKIYGDPTGRKCHEHFMGEATPCAGCGIKRALAEKTISVTEETLAREDNRPVQVTTIPFRSPDGEWLVAEVNVDISERKLVEKKNVLLAALVESSDEAIVGFDMDRTITVWNHGAERTYGFPAEEIMGKPSSLLIPPDHEDEAMATRERLLRGERLERYETLRRRKDGALIPVVQTLSMIRDPAGKPIGMASVGRDVTAEKAIQAQLIRAQRLESLSTLASGIAHQFNNINAVVKGYLDLLAVDKLHAKALGYVHMARKGVERAVEITERLLGFTTAAPRNGETSHLEDVARSILPLMTDRFREAGARVRDELVETPAVRAGASMVGFTATGLLSNALHAVLGVPEGMVSIRTGTMPGFSFLEVTDNGCGMTFEDLRRVFTPFFTTKGNGPRKARRRGTFGASG